MPGRKTKHGRSWVTHQRETIKPHSQRSCHLFEVVSAPRVQNWTRLKKFKRFLNFPLQAKYQSCKTTHSRQISPLSAGKTCLSDSRESTGSTDLLHQCLFGLSPSCSNLRRKLYPRAQTGNTCNRMVHAYKNLRTKAALNPGQWLIKIQSAFLPSPASAGCSMSLANKSWLSPTTALWIATPSFGAHFWGDRGQDTKRKTVLKANSKTTVTWGTQL